MKSLILVVILLLGSALAGTHVNISFTQQPQEQLGQYKADLVETQKDQKSQLQPSVTLEQFRTASSLRGDQNERFARIQAEDTKANDNNQNKPVADNSNMSREPVSNYQPRSERVQNSGRSGHFNHPSRDQSRGFSNSNNGDHQNYEQLRKSNAQDKQNMEFERYIQNYHSGSTVETVYESAKPKSQQTSVTSSVNEGPQRLVAGHQRMSKVQKFERLEALPPTADKLQTEADANKQAQIAVNHQPVVAAETAPSTSSLPLAVHSSSASSGPSVVDSPSNANSFKVNLNQAPSSVGKDGLNFDLSTSYNKPNYNSPSFQYDNDGYSDGDYHNQYPPAVDEHQDGYGDYYQPSYNNNDNQYYGNFYDSQQPDAGYLPVEHPNQRPHVTKTIQIAQPAIKAKKYEIRHPAIQKEFYDIEERVIIKPAGTVVVELERPVAKILKGETTLPLGHPHPAVAGAYTNNGHSPAYSNILYSSSGDASSSNQASNQYGPQYNTRPVAEHQTVKSGFGIASSGPKEVAVESSPDKHYNRDNQYAAAVKTADESKPLNKEEKVVEINGNQRQVTPAQFTYSKDETDNVPSRPVYNHRNAYAYSGNNGQNVIAQQRSGFQDSSYNNAPRRSGFQANLSQRDGYGFEAEYVNNKANNAASASQQQDSKPARLATQDFEAEYINKNAASASQQQDSKPARLEEAKPREQVPQQPLINRAHNIVLSPSQHNIYLSRNYEMPQTKYVAEAAHVQEIKPFLQSHRGPIILYASSKQSPDLAYTPRSEYKPQARVASQVVQFREPPRKSNAKFTNRNVEYSAPYAQMRFHPDEVDNANYHPQQKGFSINAAGKSERLILEDKTTTEMTAAKKSNDDIMEKQSPQAHIEIEIPHQLTQDANKAIFVSSTIRPMMMNNGKPEMHNSKLEISVTNNGEPMHQRNLNDNNENANKDLSANMPSKTNDNYEKANKDLSSNVPSDEDVSNEKDTEQISDYKIKPDCNQPAAASSENYESEPAYQNYEPQKFMRLVESPSSAAATSESDNKAADASVKNIQPQNVDINVKGAAGHMKHASSRVIAATPAPKESTPSESFHKRRIVVNHPFQTVREVVEHEPYTNYHEVQVNEPASPDHYQSANYFQPNGALRQPDYRHMASYYH